MPLEYNIDWMEECGKDFVHLHANYGGLYSKHKNESVAVKNLKAYHDANRLKRLELLMVDGIVDTEYAFILFMK